MKNKKGGILDWHTDKSGTKIWTSIDISVSKLSSPPYTWIGFYTLWNPENYEPYGDDEYIEAITSYEKTLQEIQRKTLSTVYDKINSSMVNQGDSTRYSLNGISPSWSISKHDPESYGEMPKGHHYFSLKLEVEKSIHNNYIWKITDYKKNEYAPLTKYKTMLEAKTECLNATLGILKALK